MTNFAVMNSNIRYQGHLSLCEIDIAGQQRIARGRVLIVGAGGLGSPVALYLAAAGVGHLGLVDPDTVSLSNLQRQIAHTTADIGRLKVDSARDAMLAVNPEVAVTVYPQMLTSGNAAALLEDYDVVVDCTDSRCSRLAVNKACIDAERSMVFGAVSRFSGMAFTHIPGSADYTTFFSAEADDDAQPRSCAMTGILNTVVGITGSIMATEVIKLLVGTGDLLTDRLLTFDALTMTFSELRL